MESKIKIIYWPYTIWQSVHMSYLEEGLSNNQWKHIPSMSTWKYKKCVPFINIQLANAQIFTSFFNKPGNLGMSISFLISHCIHAGTIFIKIHLRWTDWWRKRVPLWLFWFHRINLISVGLVKESKYLTRVL